MNDESIIEMLESSFDYSSDDSDNDPNWNQHFENMSTSSTSSKQNINDDDDDVNMSIDEIELSGVDAITYSDENGDPNFDLVSHISASSDNDSTTNYPRPGRPRIHPKKNVNNRQWRSDDNVIDNFIFDPDKTNSGINPDLFDTLMHGSPLEQMFYVLFTNVFRKR